jgi:hypothetical protein
MSMRYSATRKHFDMQLVTSRRLGIVYACTVFVHLGDNFSLNP